MNVLNITIYRVFKTDDVVEGCLVVHKKCLCDTLENRLFALPEGTYWLDICTEPHLEVHCPCIGGLCLLAKKDEVRESVDLAEKSSHDADRQSFESTGLAEKEDEQKTEVDFEISGYTHLGKGTCIIPGNGVYGWRSRHLVVGVRGGNGVMVRSRPVFNYLYERVRTAIRRGGKVLLTIKDETGMPQY